jgi:hypothetical protein
MNLNRLHEAIISLKKNKQTNKLYLGQNKQKKGRRGRGDRNQKRNGAKPVKLYGTFTDINKNSS